MSFNEIRLINLPKIVDSRGALSFFESLNHLPFCFKRTDIYSNLNSLNRLNYACHRQMEFIVSLYGSLELEVFKGNEKQIFKLDSPDVGLQIPKMHWKKCIRSSTTAKIIVLGSEENISDDFIRDFNIYLRLFGIEG